MRREDGEIFRGEDPENYGARFVGVGDQPRGGKSTQPRFLTGEKSISALLIRMNKHEFIPPKKAHELTRKEKRELMSCILQESAIFMVGSIAYHTAYVRQFNYCALTPKQVHRAFRDS